ncbi:MAG: hypothetical protein ACPL7M_09565, partial [Bryobacteraceae bacterium]
MINQIRKRITRWHQDAHLPEAGKAEAQRDRRGLGPDPGPAACIDASLRWLCRAQDCSASQDGGFA